MASDNFDQNMDALQYTSSERYWEGVISNVTDATVEIEIMGRMGKLEVPRRMVMTNYKMQVGQKVGFIMSYPEVLQNEPDSHYAEAFKKYHEQMDAAKQKHSDKSDK